MEWVSDWTIINNTQMQFLMYFFVSNFISGVRKPPVPFGINGRSVSGSVVPSSTPGIDRKPNFHVSTPPAMYERESPLSIHTAKRKH